MYLIVSVQVLSLVTKIADGIYKIEVRVKAGSKSTSICKGESYFYVQVKSPAQKGKANKEIIKLLSKSFRIPKSSISFISGMTSSKKYFRIECENLENRLENITDSE